MTKDESYVEAQIQMEAPRWNCILLRNNVGVLRNAQGTPVRYGLGNVSQKKNDQIKSSDDIGITTITITPDMVGKQVGVFTAIESKKEGWTYNPNDKREKAQANFIEFVQSRGGFAGFAQSVQDFQKVLESGLNRLRR